MEYCHAPQFRVLSPSLKADSGATFEEEFRDSLFSASICLSIFARLRAAEGGSPTNPANGTDPWVRLSTFLDEVNADLRESSPYADRMIGWVTVLTMVADSLDLQAVDPDYHFLLSLFIQACLIIELEQTHKLTSDDAAKNREATRARIQASLDFIVEELAERRRRERRTGPPSTAAA